ncbi:uncharacterized protein LOC124666741 isoform X2 [Lolium rigidum]|uniref:uncharacterized protein LOC124666741 isoform X2 n=1 Tax=Lolium rigidum TaxID=89674 RepID=UPI001F5C8066|nr:uncharacterized protein LOC124666741 isoform X2 [Lolium rigidum]
MTRRVSRYGPRQPPCPLHQLTIPQCILPLPCLAVVCLQLFFASLFFGVKSYAQRVELECSKPKQTKGNERNDQTDRGKKGVPEGLAVLFCLEAMLQKLQLPSPKYECCPVYLSMSGRKFKSYEMTKILHAKKLSHTFSRWKGSYLK